MKYDIREIPFEQARHGLQVPNSPQEELAWKTLDEVDQILTVLATTLVTGKDVAPDYLKDVPPAPSPLRKAVAVAFWAYVREVKLTLDNLKDLGLVPQDAGTLPDFMTSPEGSLPDPATLDW